MIAQPTGERLYILVAPHPGRETLKRRICIAASRTLAHVAVDRSGIGPVGLDSDDCETMFFDQPPRDRRACTVELRGAVTSLAEQHDTRIVEPFEHFAEIGVVEVGKRLGGVGDQAWQRSGFDQLLGVEIARPTMRPDQGHEPDGPQILRLEIVLSVPGHTSELLCVGVADRNDKASADGELRAQRLRNCRAAGGDHDGVERRRF